MNPHTVRAITASLQAYVDRMVSTPQDEIQCGSTCIATFDAGTRVPMQYAADSGSNSQFNGWSGDPDCSDGVVDMNSNVFCVANFGVRPPPSSGGSGGSSGGSGSSNCFIATAAYGTWLDPQVLILREFRDRHLLTNPAGTWFVDFYYRHSPPIADYIRERESLRAMVRAVLAVVIYAIEYPVAAVSVPLIILMLGWRRRIGAGTAMARS